MFFRNLSFVRLPTGWNMTAGSLELLLLGRPLLPCSGAAMSSIGWVSPRGDQQLVASHEKHMLIALGIEQKILPAAVINRTAKERAEKIERQQGYKVGKKQMLQLKEDVFLELLPKAFTKTYSVRAWIDPVAGYLVVDTGSISKLEMVTEALRNILTEFPCRLVDTDVSPRTTLTAWLATGAPAPFILDDEAELRGTDETHPTVRYMRHDLGGKDVAAHISDGKLATKVGLNWNERLSFVLNNALQLKKVKFLDIEKNRADSQAQNPEEQFEADFALMAGEFSKLLGDLDKAMGFTKV